MLRIIISLALLSICLANIVKRSDEDECYRCSSFDAQGRGFIEASDNPGMCGHYKECYKAKGTNVITSVDRWCAPGTYTDPKDIRRGAPCTRTLCDPAECEDCDYFPTVSTPEGVPCPYEQMSPDWLFGLRNASGLFQVGTCGANGYFNDTDDVCTCTTMEVDCTCKVSIPLTTDIESHGCNGGWVGQLGMPAEVLVGNKCGQFKGFQSLSNNGEYLGTYVMDGLFAGDWVKQLKLTADFTLAASWDSTGLDTKWGIVTYGDCAAGSSFAFSVQKNATDTYLVANLELLTTTGLEDFTLAFGGILPGVRYHAVFIYEMDLLPNSWNLYVMTDVQYDACVLGSCPAPVATSNPQGTITPRGCGFVIGYTGSDSNEEFFTGEICHVSVDIGSNAADIHPCK